MKIARSLADLQTQLVLVHRPDVVLGFVPTMGGLHDGHLSLIRTARERCGAVVASIFVNPTQFGMGEDFHSYPRDEDGDLAKLEAAGVDLVFLPTVDDMYPDGATVVVDVGPLARILEGRSRPGHFAGVATVVAKLFNAVRPDSAFFGQKDAQQVAVIRRMAADLLMPVEIVVCPTVRESGGLAMSSRNAYLSPSEKARATVLYEALMTGRESYLRTSDPEVAEKETRRVLEGDGPIDVDYAAAVRADTFEPLEQGERGLLVVAARIGTTRLIDNIGLEKPAPAGGST